MACAQSGKHKRIADILEREVITEIFRYLYYAKHISSMEENEKY